MDATRYVATINIPGYLPMDDDPPVFDDVSSAWEYLASVRKEIEEQHPDYEDDEGYSAAVLGLEALGRGDLAEAEAEFDKGDGTVTYSLHNTGYGWVHAPLNRSSEYDLGEAYCVSAAEEE